jgi:hypothetical protein
MEVGMSIIRINGKIPTIKFNREEELLKAIEAKIREYLPGINEIFALEIITEKRKAVEILAMKPDQEITKPPLDSLPIANPRVITQPAFPPCSGCNRLKDYFYSKQE